MDRYDRGIRGKWPLFGGSLILLAIAAGAISYWRSQQTPATPPLPPRPAVYEGLDVSLTGRIRPQKVVPVPSPADGVIDEYFVDVNDEVYADQLLGRVKSGRLDAAQELATLELEKAQTRVNDLDSASIAARLEVSRAEAEAGRLRSEFERAAKVYQRQQMLYREGATPRLAYERAEKEYLQLKADYETADAVAKAAADRASRILADLDAARRTLAEKQEDLDDAKEAVASGEIHSPVDGLVVARKLQAGEQVSKAEKELFQIATDLSALEVVLEPEPPVLARIKVGQQAVVRVAELPDQPLPGTVKSVDDTQVVVEFFSPSPVVRPGLTAQVLVLFGDATPTGPKSSTPASGSAPKPESPLKK